MRGTSALLIPSPTVYKSNGDGSSDDIPFADSKKELDATEILGETQSATKVEPVL